jgi:hypothetical protein
MRDHYDFSQAKRGAVVKTNKERITVRLDPDIIRLYPNLSRLNISHSTIFTLSDAFLDCTEFLRNLSRDIDITNDQVDQVDKRLHSLKSAGTILHHPDDPIEALGGRVGDMEAVQYQLGVGTMVLDGCNPSSAAIVWGKMV